MIRHKSTIRSHKICLGIGASATVSFDRSTHHDRVVPEDDLLITQDGYELLTKRLPRDPALSTLTSICTRTAR